jgi:hypothetical protein
VTAREARRLVTWPGVRNALLFLGGLSIAVHETIVGGAERPSLLILAAAMMGLPAFLRKDESK